MVSVVLEVPLLDCEGVFGFGLPFSSFLAALAFALFLVTFLELALVASCLAFFVAGGAGAGSEAGLFAFLSVTDIVNGMSQ